MKETEDWKTAEATLAEVKAFVETIWIVFVLVTVFNEFEKKNLSLKGHSKSLEICKFTKVLFYIH